MLKAFPAFGVEASSTVGEVRGFLAFLFLRHIVVKIVFLSSRDEKQYECWLVVWQIVLAKKIFLCSVTTDTAGTDVARKESAVMLQSERPGYILHDGHFSCRYKNTHL